MTAARPDLPRPDLPRPELPRHVAIIMDGNGRWARRRHLPRIAGHRAGVEAVRKVVRAAGDLGLEALTLYAFSSENWKRPADEVADLMGLLRHFIVRDVDEMAASGVRLHVIGDWRAMAPDVAAMIEDALARTAANTAQHLVVALNYGGHDEIARAARAAAAAGEVTAAAIAERLDTAHLPPVDLIVRTSGEVRLSNFLLWQAAYAEMYFCDTLWPDFGAEQLAAALTAYAGRDRRFGGL